MAPAVGHTATLPARGQAKLYVLPEPAALSGETEQRFAAWLSDEEQQRWQRLHHADDRRRFLLARALVRSVLATCLQQTPESLQFTRNRYGKPELVQTAGTPEQTVKFNVSHTQGMLLLGVTLVDEIGVDVESTAREAEMLALAERYFAATEAAMLRGLPADGLRERFFRLWTLKEAYVKARGLGLQLGLDAFAFSFARDGSPYLAAGDDASNWSFFSTDHAGLFRMAVAVNARQVWCKPVLLDAAEL